MESAILAKDSETLAINSHIKALVQKKTDDLLSLWQMSPAEKIVLLSVLKEINPDVSIEIGTYKGGSLTAISEHSKTVYSLDILPECEQRLKPRFDNVIFKTGDSKVNIPLVLKEIEKQKRHLQFVLIDGDHSREGVRRDINLILKYRPTKPMIIILHDSFNPPCRTGMLEAEWEYNPYVHSVNLDFVPGCAHLFVRGREMWGGFGAAFLNPQPRHENLEIREPQRWIYDEIWPKTSHPAHTASQPGALRTVPQGGYYDFFAQQTEEQLQAFLTSGQKGQLMGNEPEGFIEIRRRLESLLPIWRKKNIRLAIYGAGKHTLALMGLMPELYPLISTFIDRNASGKYLGKPSIKPDRFNSQAADVVVYSSKAGEEEMYKSFAHHNVEHVRLYSK